MLNMFTSSETSQISFMGGNVDLLCELESFEDLEMGNLSVQVYLHLPSHHLKMAKQSSKNFKNAEVKNMF